eukprot:scaffold7095_cov260-Pinguiococcus_pyrenoidosus.AAC.2
MGHPHIDAKSFQVPPREGHVKMGLELVAALKVRAVWDLAVVEVDAPLAPVVFGLRDQLPREDLFESVAFLVASSFLDVLAFTGVLHRLLVRPRVDRRWRVHDADLECRAVQCLLRGFRCYGAEGRSGQRGCPLRFEGPGQFLDPFSRLLTALLLGSVRWRSHGWSRIEISRFLASFGQRCALLFPFERFGQFHLQTINSDYLPVPSGWLKEAKRVPRCERIRNVILRLKLAQALNDSKRRHDGHRNERWESRGRGRSLRTFAVFRFPSSSDRRPVASPTGSAPSRPLPGFLASAKAQPPRPWRPTSPLLTRFALPQARALLFGLHPTIVGRICGALIIKLLAFRAIIVDI